ncbi:eIF-2-alpha kinase activator GCN1-like isoform X2 [Xenia sp. Carnegie-2017]|uniref:eIF-2-alpha kinase activator GCN1-like isoform X2 n=1 Tax=Xenia sp. Carnegie-2017 TaxID=2897299 RepID=UPI001F033B8F|nr:eIF-2-alpha kinase activator GCN1-like isoform X2 [Xenia sp. Carnegie-2017]
MADSRTKMENILVRCIESVASPKIRQRKIVFVEWLYPCIEMKEFSQFGVKAMAKIIEATLYLYNDNYSRFLVIESIKAVMKQHSVAFQEPFVKMLYDIVKNIKPDRSLSKCFLAPFKWSCLLTPYIFANQKDHQLLKKFVYSQSILLCTVFAGCSSVQVASKKWFHKALKQNPDAMSSYLEEIFSSNPSVVYLRTMSEIFSFCCKMEHGDIFHTYKEKAVDLYVNSIFTGKKRASICHLRDSSPLLYLLNHEEFADKILPVVQKSLLRNPELVIAAVKYLIKDVSIDLSRYVTVLCKTLTVHLHAKDVTIREEAILCFENLAQQCSDWMAIKEIIEQLFDVLNGREGKLTVWNDRLAVLKAIGCTEKNMVNGNSHHEQLACFVVQKMETVLQQEVNENVVFEALVVLQRWCFHFHDKVPKNLFNMFEKVMENKKTTSVVRRGYLNCIAASCCGNTLNEAMSAVPHIYKIFEKALSQSYQANIVSESLTSLLLLLQLVQFNVELEDKFPSLWSSVYCEKSHVFSSAKFLSTADVEVFRQFHLILEQLILRVNDDKEKDRITSLRWWFCGLLFTLTHRNYKIRHLGKTCFLKLCLLAFDGGKWLQSILLNKFREFFQENMNLNVSNDEKLDRKIPSKIWSEVLYNIVTIPLSDCADIAYVEEVLVDVLLDCHHPSLASTSPYLWQDLLETLIIDGKDLIQKKKDKILKDLLSSDNFENLPACVRVLIKIGESVLFDDIINHVIHVFTSEKFQNVTNEEISILKTPEGVLFDRSKLKELKYRESLKSSNIKRESKVYSYEEQLEEIELRNEIMKKKCLNEYVQLTKKDREILQAQLAQESEVRKRVQKLDEEFKLVCCLAQSTIATNPPSLRHHIPILIQCMTSLFQSPLAAPHVSRVFMTLGKQVFPRDHQYFGERLTWLILQLHCSLCELDLKWSEKYLKVGVERLVNDLYEMIEDKLRSNTTLLSTTFTFCFPLLRCVIKDVPQPMELGTKEKVMIIISRHCSLRMSERDIDERYSETCANNLPRKDVLILMKQIIETYSDQPTASKIHRLACDNMVALCESGSGEENCTIASLEEIEVLLTCLQSPISILRYNAVQCLKTLNLILTPMEPDCQQVFPLVQRVWVAKFDGDHSTAKLADRLWTEMRYYVQERLCHNLVSDIISDVDDIQQSASNALSAALEYHPNITDEILHLLIKVYNENLEIPALKQDNLGRVIEESFPDHWKKRRGVAVALLKIASLFKYDEAVTLFTFFVTTSLGDRNEKVRDEMLNAALVCLNHLGKENTSSLLAIFEDYLDMAPDSSSHDVIRQSVIILMGSLAKHLDKDDPKVQPIVMKLLSALSTPSQPVQEAVAKCLPPLVPVIKDEASDIIKNLLTKLLDSTVYGERRGAAYGLASFVKGLGILSLKQQNIITTLQNAIQDKKNYRHREGALFAFELLCHILGRLFEPYVIHVLPSLLLCFGDGNKFVREATDDTARAMMRNLSGHGVKLVLPSLLKALSEDAWRTKTGSVELLGAMAYCAPKQLSSCLPSIVPRLLEVLTDPHLKVQKAASQALNHIGSVIRNPEIQAISSVLLEALSHPTSKTTEALQVLLMTSFVHVIDAPSLAIIMPIIHRALASRSTETKKMAAQIIGNMYSLTDQKDLNPYLSSVIPGLKQALLDPVPEVRAVSARALGALVKELGEENCLDLLPWLMETLVSETSSVDRSGAAQGLSEVLYGLGFHRLCEIMPEVISTTEKIDLPAHIREGYLMLYLYLPSTFGDRFMSFVGKIIPSILKGLSDESEFVRETSLKAGQRIVNQYASTAIEVFLPQLEDGLLNENWRIRMSSVQLMGDLLYKISGVTGKMTTEGEEDDNFGTTYSNKVIIERLGFERRNRVFSGLYMGRSDVSLPVRQAALHVWKVVVPNTPRVLREILSTLFSLLLGCLASSSNDKQQIAARTLGDLVRKLGERILPEIIPIFERGLKSNEREKRLGVCIGLSEIIESTSKEQVLLYIDSVIPTVRQALCDPLPEVRRSAAETFNYLFKKIGAKALNDIIPDLLQQLAISSLHDVTMDGLREVMAVRSKEVLPFIIPQLILPPVSTQVLASISSVAGDSLTDYLDEILTALITALSKATDENQLKQDLENSQTLILSIHDTRGSKIILDILIKYSGDVSLQLRKAAMRLLLTYCACTKYDLLPYMPLLLQCILKRCSDSDVELLEINWNTLDSVCKRLSPSEQVEHIPHVRCAIKYTCDAVQGDLPGFCLPKKGVAPLLPIFREGILNGPPDVKQEAAEGLGQIINLTSPSALKPSVINITGPLIRILGDRFSWNVKVAVLQTLKLLLMKVGGQLRAFLPQLQTTFIKALNDVNKTVRIEASSALQHLVQLHSRVDALFMELNNMVKNCKDNEIRETILQAFRGVILSVGEKMGENLRHNLTTAFTTLQSHSDESIRVATAGCLGALLKFLPREHLLQIIKTDVCVDDATVEWTLRHGRLLTMSCLIYDCSQILVELHVFHSLLSHVNCLLSNDRIPICKTAIRCLSYAAVKETNSFPKEMLNSFVEGMHHTSTEIRVFACDAIYYISENTTNIPGEFLNLTLSDLVSLTKDKNTLIKCSAENALCSIMKYGKDESHLKECFEAVEISYRSRLVEFQEQAIPRILHKGMKITTELENPFPFCL